MTHYARSCRRHGFTTHCPESCTFLRFIVSAEFNPVWLCGCEMTAVLPCLPMMRRAAGSTRTTRHRCKLKIAHQGHYTTKMNTPACFCGSMCVFWQCAQCWRMVGSQPRPLRPTGGHAANCPFHSCTSQRMSCNLKTSCTACAHWLMAGRSLAIVERERESKIKSTSGAHHMHNEFVPAQNLRAAIS